MKTHKHLYPQVTAFDNLYNAFKGAARGKRSHADVARFEYELEENLTRLQEELETKTYQPGRYFSFRIYDPKPRLISAAPFRDRVVHHALCQIIEPLFERRFMPSRSLANDSYACRVGKGTHAALNRAQQFARQYPYVLKMDLEHFFPTIDLAILRAQLAHVIADPETMWLIDQILHGGAGVNSSEAPPYYFPGDDLFAALRPRGLPIGNLTSQFWANVYLNPLDQFIKRELKCHGYVRYVDDLLLFAPDKPTLHPWRKRAIEFAATLRQHFHENEAMVFPTRTGIPFLGWRVYPTHRLLKRRNGVAFQRRLNKLCAQLADGEITLERVDLSVKSWLAHAQHGDTYGLRRAVLSRKVIPRPKTVA
ncbi:MAG: RNA-dependent DNA polymerase [Chloroflexi bacterium]|nr:RNA-dependent DNA polymerase [Chloroflexota bacterium]